MNAVIGLATTKLARGLGFSGRGMADDLMHIAPGFGRNRVLDGWRGLSVLGVIIGHAVTYRFAVTIPPLHTTIHNPADLAANLGLRVLSSLGEVGVSFFFVISGYLITTLLISEDDSKGRVSIWAFYIRRIFRIMPAFYLYLSTIFIASALGWVEAPAEAFIRSGLYVCNFSGFKCSWWLAHTWSLSAEEQFYLCWPLVFVLLGKNRSPGITAITAIAFVSSWAYDWLSPFVCIATGAMVATRQDVRLLIRVAARPQVVLCAALLIVVQPLLFPAPALARSLHLVEPGLVALVLFGTLLAPSATPVQRLLSMPVLTKIGVVSYSLYLWQQLSLAPLVWGGTTTGVPALYQARPVLTATIFVPVSVASYVFVERPMIRIGHRLSRFMQERTGSSGSTNDSQLPAAS